MYNFGDIKYTFDDKTMSVFTKDSFCKEEEDEVINYFYKMKVSRYKYRLDLMGYTLIRARKEFDALFKFEEYFEDLDDEYMPKDVVNFNFFIEKLNLFLSDEQVTEPTCALLEYMFNNEWPNKYIYGIPVSDIRLVVRIVLEFCDEDEDVIYYLTDLIASGFFVEEYDFVGQACKNLSSTGQFYDKTIIVTEGKADIAILRKAFELHYTGEKDFFEFFDYGYKKLRGGTDEVLKLAKTFETIGIRNRIIFLFDNDTAGRNELARFNKENFSDNMKAFCYPDIEIANLYPAYKNSKLSIENINGKAVSIELFLGSNILKDKGKYIPIEWKDNDQGVIQKKEAVKNRFYKMCKENPNDIDWKDLDKIFKILFNASIS